MALARTLTLGAWEFHLAENGGDLYIRVPDCGGMADSMPRAPEQLAWAEQAFAALPALERVWSTTAAGPPRKENAAALAGGARPG